MTIKVHEKLLLTGAAGGLKKLGEAGLADSMDNIDLDASYEGNKITVNSQPAGTNPNWVEIVDF